MNVEEMNVLRISGRKIVRKLYGPIKEREHWRIRTNKQTKDITQGEDTVKFIKFLQLRLSGQGERMQN
jgi:hypothetical protein